MTTILLDSRKKSIANLVVDQEKFLKSGRWQPGYGHTSAVLVAADRYDDSRILLSEVLAEAGAAGAFAAGQIDCEIHGGEQGFMFALISLLVECVRKRTTLSYSDQDELTSLTHQLDALAHGLTSSFSPSPGRRSNQMRSDMMRRRAAGTRSSGIDDDWDCDSSSALFDLDEDPHYRMQRNMEWANSRTSFPARFHELLATLSRCVGNRIIAVGVSDPQSDLSIACGLMNTLNRFLAIPHIITFVAGSADLFSLALRKDSLSRNLTGCHLPPDEMASAARMFQSGSGQSLLATFPIHRRV